MGFIGVWEMQLTRNWTVPYSFATAVTTSDLADSLALGSGILKVKSQYLTPFFGGWPCAGFGNFKSEKAPIYRHDHPPKKMLIIVCRIIVSMSVLESKLMTSILKRFGEKVRNKRLKLGLSQEELAERATVHRTYIGMIERAEKNITLENIEKLAKALKLRINELLNID